VNDAVSVSTIETQTRIEAADDRRDLDALRALIDADCDVSSAPGGGATILHRNANVAELADRAGNEWVFQKTPETFRERHPCTPLITGAVRRRVGSEGRTMTTLGWLTAFADGALVSSRACP
jgi:hypothetical protein